MQEPSEMHRYDRVTPVVAGGAQVTAGPGRPANPSLQLPRCPAPPGQPVTSRRDADPVTPPHREVGIPPPHLGP
jgi:hypothetical protein